MFGCCCGTQVSERWRIVGATVLGPWGFRPWSNLPWAASRLGNYFKKMTLTVYATDPNTGIAGTGSQVWGIDSVTNNVVKVSETRNNWIDAPDWTGAKKTLGCGYPGIVESPDLYQKSRLRLSSVTLTNIAWNIYYRNFVTGSFVLSGQGTAQLSEPVDLPQYSDLIAAVEALPWGQWVVAPIDYNRTYVELKQYAGNTGEFARGTDQLSNGDVGDSINQDVKAWAVRVSYRVEKMQFAGAVRICVQDKPDINAVNVICRPGKVSPGIITTVYPGLMPSTITERTCNISNNSCQRSSRTLIVPESAWGGTCCA